MTDRDRLIELLDKVQYQGNSTETGINYIQNSTLADYLLANGVTVSPISIGSTVYEIRARGKRPALCGMRKCDYGIATDLMFKNAIAKGLELYVKEKSFVKYDKTRWNKTIFTTRAEAETKIKERKYNE